MLHHSDPIFWSHITANQVLFKQGLPKFEVIQIERKFNRKNEEENERKQQETRKMFRKFVNDDDDVYYENMETGEVVWNMPEDGKLGL